MKIEIGKRYVTRDGRVTGEVTFNDFPSKDLYPYKCSVIGEAEQMTVLEDGSYFPGRESRSDLIREYRSIPKRFWSILFVVLCMSIGAVINSFVYNVQRTQWKITEQKRLAEEWEKVNAAHESVDSLLNDARQIHQQAGKEASSE